MAVTVAFTLMATLAASGDNVRFAAPPLPGRYHGQDAIWPAARTPIAFCVISSLTRMGASYLVSGGGS